MHPSFHCKNHSRELQWILLAPSPEAAQGNGILVVCDYATRYPEAIQLRSVDAPHIAEELVTLFSRVGIPDEILTDQEVTLPLSC